MPDLPVHAQPSAPARPWSGRDPGADLCRRDPALFSRIVRYSDELERDGVEGGEAWAHAWQWFVGEPWPA